MGENIDDALTCGFNSKGTPFTIPRALADRATGAGASTVVGFLAIIAAVCTNCDTCKLVERSFVGFSPGSWCATVVSKNKTVSIEHEDDRFETHHKLTRIHHALVEKRSRACRHGFEVAGR